MERGHCAAPATGAGAGRGLLVRRHPWASRTVRSRHGRARALRHWRSASSARNGEAPAWLVVPGRRQIRRQRGAVARGAGARAWERPRRARLARRRARAGPARHRRHRRGTRLPPVSSRARKSKLAAPVQLRLLDAVVAAKRGADAEALAQEMLAGDLDSATRAWVLLRKGDNSRLNGNMDEARTQYELARTAAGTSDTAQYAAFRLAQTNFEFREFAQAATDSAQVVLSAGPARSARGGTASPGRGRLCSRGLCHRRCGVRQTARRGPAASGGAAPAPGAGLDVPPARSARASAPPLHGVCGRVSARIPAEPMLSCSPRSWHYEARIANTARRLLEQVIEEYPTNPRTQFARLNLAILLARTGDTAAAQRALTEWLAQSPFPPFIGRARTSPWRGAAGGRPPRRGCARVHLGPQGGRGSDRSTGARDGCAPREPLGRRRA